MRVNSGTVRGKGLKATCRKNFLHLVTCFVSFVSILGLSAFKSHSQNAPQISTASQTNDVKSPRTFADLIALQPNELAGTDIALMNLLCAEGLPGAESLKVNECMATLDKWAGRVDSETKRNYHRFREDPSYYYNSEAFYKMLMMAVVVYEDFGIRYNPKWITSPSETKQNDHFFADSRNILIHGMLGSTPMGTCSSMPILYVALGRRLGYPLKLVSTKEHLFMRWDSPTERFDMDATGKGLDKYDDDHYKKWPFPLNDEEIKNEGYLKSMTTAEELSVFLSIRAACLTECGRFAEATLTFRSAYLREPNWRANQIRFAEAERAQKTTELNSTIPQQSPLDANTPVEPNPLQHLQSANPQNKMENL